MTSRVTVINNYVCVVKQDTPQMLLPLSVYLTVLIVSIFACGFVKLNITFFKYNLLEIEIPF